MAAKQTQAADTPSPAIQEEVAPPPAQVAQPVVAASPPLEEQPALNAPFAEIQPTEPDRPRRLAVTDATAINGVREHEVNKKTYRFMPGQATAMPFDDAMLLVNIPSFTIIGPNGETYKPAQTEVTPGSRDLRLRNDQIIGTLYELMIGALRDRAMRWKDHPEYDTRLGREELIQFIMERQGEMSEPAKVERKPGRSARAELDDDYDEQGFPIGDGSAGQVSQAEIQRALAREAEATAGARSLTGFGFRG